MEARGRLQEIDIAKGMACLLMIAAHVIPREILPFGTLAAPLFFACSGMNTILLIARTAGNRCYDLFHVLFPLLLFFGGFTHVVITRIDAARRGLKLLQFIALAVLLLFLLSKIFRDRRRCGILFPIPFLVQQLLPRVLSASSLRALPEFLFSGPYPLFPWFGFFLFGVFVLGLKARSYRWLQASLAIASALCIALAGIPLRRSGMSLSYILLGLLAIMAALSLARSLDRHAGSAFCQWLGRFFALPGQNALMFLYVHLVALHFFVAVDFLPAPGLYLALETLYLYFACWVFLLFYERVKKEEALFFPVLLLSLTLAALRWAGLMRLRGGLYVVDMIIGILFAFLYVQARRRFAARCDPTAAGRPS